MSHKNEDEEHLGNENSKNIKFRLSENSENENNEEFEDDDDGEFEDLPHFECKYCKFGTEDLDQLDEHIVSLHSYEEEASENDGPRDPLLLDRPLKDPVYEIAGSSKDPDYEIAESSKDPVYAIEDSNNSGPEIYVCHVCNYETPKGKVMRHHLTIHEEPDIVLYKCSICSYETKRKCDMPKHLLSHCTNVEMYKCPECPYATKRKNDLPKHLLCHKKPTDMELHECEFCGYCTKRKGDLRKHVLTHRDAAVTNLYDCTECVYSSPRQADVNKHMLVHCDKQQVGIFKCLKCKYATDRPTKFAKHVLSNCEMCDNAILSNSNEYIILEGSIEDIEQNYEEEVQAVDSENVNEIVTNNSDDTGRIPYRKRTRRSSASPVKPGIFQESNYSSGSRVPRGYSRSRVYGYQETESKRFRILSREPCEESE